MMTNFKKKITEINKAPLLTWMFFFGVILAAYIQFLNPYITCDHVGMALFQIVPDIPGWEEIKGLLETARFGSIFVMWIYYLLGQMHVTHYSNIYVIQILGSVLYACSASILFGLFKNFLKERVQRTLLGGFILICFINPFMVETYVYGSFDWGFGILFAVFAAKWFVEGKLVRGFLCALLAVSIYQTNILLVIIIAFTFILAESVESTVIAWKKVLIKVFRTGVLSILAAAVTIIVYKIYAMTGNYVNPSKATNVSANYFQLFKDILKSMRLIYTNMYSMFPVYFVPVFVLMNWLIALYVLLIKQKRFSKAIIWTVLIGILFMTPFAYMLASSNTWAVQRTLLSIFFAIAMLFIGTLLIVKNNKFFVNLLCVLSLVFMFVNLYYTQTCIVDTYMGQALDYNEVICIQSEIEEYENNTGIEVKTISWKKSPEAVYVHPLLQLQNDNIYTHRIIYDAGDYLLKYVSQRDYELLWMTEEEYQTYFGGQSFKVFNPSEQLHFDGDTLYWAVY